MLLLTVQTVTAPTVKSDEESQVEATANKFADEAQTPTSTVAAVNSSASSDTETTSESVSQSGEKVV